MKNLKKPLNIGLLVKRIVETVKPKDSLDLIHLERSIVYSWEDLSKEQKKFIPMELALFFQVLGYCEVLADSVFKFRQKFGLPPEGIPFKKYEKLICRIYGKKLYMFDTIPEMRNGNYEKAQKFLDKFVKENVVPNPLPIYLYTIFFAGFVDIAYNPFPDLYIQIPFVQDYITGTIEQYRPPIAIFINSSKVSKKRVHELIDKKWHEISLYFKKHPYISDVKLAKEKLHALVMKMQGKTSSEILNYLNEENIKQGKEIIAKEDDAIRQEISRTRKELARLIHPREK